LVPTSDGGDERLGMGVVIVEEAVDSGLEVGDGPEDAALEASLCEASGVPHEELPIPHVAREHGVGGVAGLLPDLERRNAGAGCAGRESCPQAVAGIALRIESCRSQAFLDERLPRRRGDRLKPVRVDRRDERQGLVRYEPR